MSIAVQIILLMFIGLLVIFASYAFGSKPESKDPDLLLRQKRARRLQYIEGERQLMAEWEAAFGGYHLEDEMQPLRIEAGANNHPIIPDAVSSGGYEYRREDRHSWRSRQHRMSQGNPALSMNEYMRTMNPPMAKFMANPMMPPSASQLRRPLKTYSWEDEARCIGLSMNQHTYTEYQTFLADIRKQGKGLSQQLDMQRYACRQRFELEQRTAWVGEIRHDHIRV